MQSTLLALLSLSLFVLGILGEIGYAITLPNPLWGDPGFLVSLLIPCVALVPYLLSRTPHIALGAALLIGLATGGSFLLAIPVDNPNSLFLLDFLFVSVLLTSLFFSVRAVLLLVIAHLIGIMLYAYAVDSPGFNRVDVFVGPFTFNLIASAILMLITLYRNWLERQRQVVLRSDEMRFRVLVENSTDLVVFVDRDGTIRYAMPSLTRVLGYTQANFVSKKYADFLHPADQAEFEDMLAALISYGQSGRTVSRQLLTRDLDGEWRWMEVSATNLLHEPTIKSLVLNLRDVTERNRAERSLEQSQTIEQALRDTIQALTSTLDFEAVMTRILENIERVVPHDAANIVLFEADNNKIAYWRNYSAEVDAVFRSGVIPPGLARTLRELSRTGTPLLVSDTALYPNWDPFPASLRIKSYIGMPLKAHGKAIGILNVDSFTSGFFQAEHVERLAVFADQAAVAIENAQLYSAIREHAADLETRVAQRTAELTQANARLTELDQLKSSFIANASHELRTPLTSINNRLYLIRKNPEQMANHLDALERATKRMVRLTEDLLDTSRFERGVIELHRQRFVLQDVINEVVETQQLEAQRKNISLSVIAPESTILLFADRGRISQVIMNLVVNAINYTPTGGTVQIEAALGGPDGQCVALRVKDSGIGISAENIKRVFEPFFRANEDTIRGTGLGLAITKEIVELHRGTIQVESTLGQGSIFTVHLQSAES